MSLSRQPSAFQGYIVFFLNLRVVIGFNFPLSLVTIYDVVFGSSCGTD